ncbi:MAG: hypothetical protein H7Z38_03325, partial [Rubrivivax sp.]|nr:hypothetical protein [Pyrinomonadaceae bacterium]
MKGIQRFSNIYRWMVTAVGGLVCAYAAARLSPAALDLRFLVLVICTLGFGSRLTVRIPRVSGEVSVSDTFIFITLLLYGVEPAVLLAAVEAMLSSSRFSRRKVTVFFNGAVMAVSTLLAARSLEFFFGRVTDLRLGDYSARYIEALI